MARCKVGDISLNVEEAGAGPPLLLAHGFPLDHTMWQAQIEQLAGQAHVLAPDLRGFGASDAAGESVSMQDFADDLAALLDARRILEPVVFCGLSMGGYIAWQFWHRHRARLRALILCDTRAAGDAPLAAEARRINAQRVLAEGAGFLADAMLDKLFAAETRQRRPEVVEAARRVMQAAPPEGVAAALRGMAVRPDVSAWLPQIDVPALVIWGDKDSRAAQEAARRLAAAMPQAVAVILPDVDHFVPMRAPERFGDEALSFLERVAEQGV